MIVILVVVKVVVVTVRRVVVTGVDSSRSHVDVVVVVDAVCHDIVQISDAVDIMVKGAC